MDRFLAAADDTGSVRPQKKRVGESAAGAGFIFAVDDAVCYDRSAVHRATVYGFGLYCENELQHDDMVGAYFIFHSFRGPADARRRQG